MGIDNISIPMEEILGPEASEILNELERITRENLYNEIMSWCSVAQDEGKQKLYEQMAYSIEAKASINGSTFTTTGRIIDVPEGMEADASMMEENADTKSNIFINDRLNDYVNSDSIQQRIMKYIEPYLTEEIANKLGGALS